MNGQSWDYFNNLYFLFLNIQPRDLKLNFYNENSIFLQLQWNQHDTRSETRDTKYLTKNKRPFA
jgi:hypothetical protein